MGDYYYEVGEQPMPVLPAGPGVYALEVRLPALQELQVGRLGKFLFPAGDYVYVGSAAGPGGLRGRVGRHLRGDGKIHWHIDYLRAAAWVVAVCCRVIALQDLPGWECRWSQTLVGLKGASSPAAGFGASDCQQGCPAHLVKLPADLPGWPGFLIACPSDT